MLRYDIFNDEGGIPKLYLLVSEFGIPKDCSHYGCTLRVPERVLP